MPSSRSAGGGEGRETLVSDHNMWGVILKGRGRGTRNGKGQNLFLRINVECAGHALHFRNKRARWSSQLNRVLHQ